MESACHDVLLHYSCRWLSSDKVLLMYVKCLVEVRAFLIGQEKAYPELEDEKWLIKGMFLADITMHFSKLDLCLQPTEQIVVCLFEIWKKFLSN